MTLFGRTITSSDEQLMSGVLLLYKLLLNSLYGIYTEGSCQYVQREKYLDA